MSKAKNHYKTLGVPVDAGFEQIKRAYRELARRHHPDHHDGDRNKEERFREINAAHEILSDPAKRMEYDFTFLNQGPLRSYGPSDRARAMRDARVMSDDAGNSGIPGVDRADPANAAGGETANLGARRTLCVLGLSVLLYFVIHAVWLIAFRQDSSPPQTPPAPERPGSVESSPVGH